MAEIRPFADRICENDQNESNIWLLYYNTFTSFCQGIVIKKQIRHAPGREQKQRKNWIIVKKKQNQEEKQTF